MSSVFTENPKSVSETQTRNIAALAVNYSVRCITRLHIASIDLLRCLCVSSEINAAVSQNANPWGSRRLTQQQLRITTNIPVSDKKNHDRFPTTTCISCRFLSHYLNICFCCHGFCLHCAKAEIHEEEIKLVRDDQAIVCPLMAKLLNPPDTHTKFAKKYVNNDTDDAAITYMSATSKYILSLKWVLTLLKVKV